MHDTPDGGDRGLGVFGTIAALRRNRDALRAAGPGSATSPRPTALPETDRSPSKDQRAVRANKTNVRPE